MRCIRISTSRRPAAWRLWMLVLIVRFFEDAPTGSSWGYWALYTASPLRAFEDELGVQDAVGFWDPVGFTSDGSM